MHGLTSLPTHKIDYNFASRLVVDLEFYSFYLINTQSIIHFIFYSQF